MLQQMVSKTSLHGLVIGLIKRRAHSSWIFVLQTPSSYNQPTQFCHHADIIVLVHACRHPSQLWDH